MGCAAKLIDTSLLLYFLVIAVVVPLLDAQIPLPYTFFPHFLGDLKAWYIANYDDYLMAEKPHFYVGLHWLQLVFQWPLALLNIHAILTAKPWFNTTCLIYGVSMSTFMVAILSEMIGSERASNKLFSSYVPFLVFGVLATLRGLLPHSTATGSSVSKNPRIKRA